MPRTWAAALALGLALLATAQLIADLRPPSQCQTTYIYQDYAPIALDSATARRFPAYSLVAYTGDRGAPPPPGKRSGYGALGAGCLATGRLWPAQQSTPAGCCCRAECHGAAGALCARPPGVAPADAVCGVGDGARAAAPGGRRPGAARLGDLAGSGLWRGDVGAQRPPAGAGCGLVGCGCSASVRRPCSCCCDSLRELGM